MSEALARSVLPENQFEVRSAGSQPAGIVFPGTLAYLEENNYSIDGLKSQSWDEFEDFDPDVVITVCDSAAGEACPVWMGKTAKVHWPLADPSKEPDAGKQKEKFKLIGGMISQRLSLISELPLTGLAPEELSAAIDQVLNAEQSI